MVIPELLDAFLTATEENAVASRREAGVLRFVVLSDRADAGHVVLVEVRVAPHELDQGGHRASLGR